MDYEDYYNNSDRYNNEFKGLPTRSMVGCIIEFNITTKKDAVEAIKTGVLTYEMWRSKHNLGPKSWSDLCAWVGIRDSSVKRSHKCPHCGMPIDVKVRVCL